MTPNTTAETRIATSAAPTAVEDTSTRRLACLLEVAQVVNSSLELDEVLRQVLDQAVRILSAEGGSVMLLEPATRELRVVEARGPRARLVRGRHQPLGEGVAGWVALHGEPLLLHGSAADPRFSPVCRRRDVRDALCVPLRTEDQVLGVLSLNNRTGAEPFAKADLELLTALAHQAALAIRNAQSYREMQHQRRTVERLLEELTRAQEEERARVSLLLHDGPAQTLFAALRNLEMARALIADDPSQIGGALDELEHTIRHAIRETRGVMVDLRPLCLDDIGLYSALRQYAGQFEQRSGIRTRVARRGLERRLPGMLESCFYRIAQEALTNVWKHAEARQAEVCLEVRAGSCSLEIRDDGKGFDPDVAAQNEAQHLGLRSLRERAQLLGGHLSLTCTPGEGTVVRVSAPLTD